MRNRAELIERKRQVIAEAAALRREAERLRRDGGRRPQRRLARLEARIEALAAEEHRLRQAIDRAPRRS